MPVFHDIGELTAALDSGLHVRRRDISEGSRILSDILYVPEPELVELCNSLDPLSEEYSKIQFDLFEKIAGAPHQSEHEGHDTPADDLFVVQNAHPFHMSPVDVGYWTVIFGHILQHLNLAKGARVLEVGYGQAGLTELLVRSGLNVTGVEMRPTNANHALARLRPLGLDFTALTGDVARLELPGQYDAVVFFESFHHLPRFWEVLHRLTRFMRLGGKIVFAAEPIVNDDNPVIPFKWGLRMDGGALAAGRDVGWIELGFRHQFFWQMAERFGLSLEERRLDGYHHSHVVIGTVTSFRTGAPRIIR